MSFIPLLGGALNFAGSMFNSSNTSRENRRSQQFAREMYQQQYQDNINLWQMQNEYNHPASQMERLRSAGLNPRLIYGQGSGGAAGNASAAQGAAVKNAQFNSPDFGNAFSSGFDSFMSSMYDLEMKSATVDKLRTQNTVLLGDVALKAAQAANTRSGTRQKDFNLGLAKQLEQTSLDAAKANLDKTMADTRFTLDQNERAKAMNSSNLQEAAERILNHREIRAKTRQEIKNLQAQKRDIQKSTELKQLDINLKKNGVQPTDSIYWRILGQVVGRKGIIEQLEGHTSFKN